MLWPMFTMELCCFEFADRVFSLARLPASALTTSNKLIGLVVAGCLIVIKYSPKYFVIGRLYGYAMGTSSIRRFLLVYNLFPVVLQSSIWNPTPKSFAKTFSKAETMFTEASLPVKYTTFPQLMGSPTLFTWAVTSIYIWRFGANWPPVLI